MNISVIKKHTKKKHTSGSRCDTSRAPAAGVGGVDDVGIESTIDGVWWS